ncbi:hypothetical protein V5799_000700 [Amblyomma americanum]|uniref:Uncharacterized protein n=1 Tax=Amblyomma americanum TaxID=6943 RepID=A0AAQ4D2B4_AMBAM
MASRFSPEVRIDSRRFEGGRAALSTAQPASNDSVDAIATSVGGGGGDLSDVPLPLILDELRREQRRDQRYVLIGCLLVSLSVGVVVAVVATQLSSIYASPDRRQPPPPAVAPPPQRPELSPGALDEGVEVGAGRPPWDVSLPSGTLVNQTSVAK